MRAVFVATVVAFLVSLFGTPYAIKYLTRLKAGQPIRTTAPVGPVPPHQGKKGTPTMGGVIFILSTVLAYVVGHLALLTLPSEQIAQVTPTITALVLLGLFVFCGAVGFIDDYLKVRRRNSGGLSKTGKLVGQLIVGAIFGVIAISTYFKSSNGNTVGSTKISFIKDISWAEIGEIGAVILFIVMIIATSNAVNITDGLDGLATGSSVMVLGAFSFIGYWQYQHWCADWQYATGGNYCYQVRDPLEIAMIGAAAAGACVGFLWWNTNPAKIFMGDTGALGLGGLIGGMAIATRTELLLPIMGGLFVTLMGSVILQMASYRLTKKRIFRMSPLQHHFELVGWSEVNIVIRFWIIAGIFVVLGLGIFYSDYLAAQA